MESLITLLDLIILLYKLLIFIINILYLEIKVIFELKRIVNIATRDYLILSI
jgi:hypothetical protein